VAQRYIEQPDLVEYLPWLINDNYSTVVTAINHRSDTTVWDDNYSLFLQSLLLSS